MKQKMQLQDLKRDYDKYKAYTHLLEEREKLHRAVVNGEIEREKLTDLDHKLDELETYAEAKTHLITALDSPPEYQALEARLHKAQTNSDEKQTLVTSLEAFRSAMRQGAETKTMRSWLGYLLGRNPQVILARVIRKASIEAERLDVDDERVTTFITTFLEEANRNWNHALYKERFYELYEEFCRIDTTLQDELDTAKNRVRDIENAIEEWIDKKTQPE